MVQVLGTSYRIVQAGPLHEVFRLLDDRLVGSFRHTPRLAVVKSVIGVELMREIARQALRSSRIEWRPRKAWVAGLLDFLLFWRAGKPALTRELA
jgi:hypothetical protein